MSPASPDFFLQNPIARTFMVTHHFNEPREYTFAPTKLQLHEGVDIAALDAQGRPVAVLAAQRGMVDKVGFSPKGYGNYVRIVHPWQGETWVTWYGHMTSVTAREGQFIQAGQKLGIAGTTGFSTGVHLHITLQHIGHGLANYTVDDVVDPEPFFFLGDVPLFDESFLVADVTVPDGTVMKPGQRFQKIWRLRNSGTTTWGVEYRLSFCGDEAMEGPESVGLAEGPVLPGQLADVTVMLTAPAVPGRHRSTWRLCNESGTLCEQAVFTVIEIKDTKPFDEAAFVADVTVEDGTVIQPNAPFTKTWRLRNSGTTTWDDQYSLRFVSDNRMGGPDHVALPRRVRPGEFVELSVSLTAPPTPGRQRSTWALFNGSGQRFPYDLYAEIQVPKLKTSGRLSEARWVADVTIPDETKMQPGQRFVKTWRIRNTGTTTWGEGFTLAYFGDDRMGGPESVPLPPAQPGETVEVSVRLVAPLTPGPSRSTWKPRDAQGRSFEFDQFALIEVVKPQTTRPTLDELSFVEDVTIPDGMLLRPGETFVKRWRLRNTGTTTWDDGYMLVFCEEDRMDGPESVPLPPAKPGEIVEVAVTLTAPTSPGLHKSVWKGRTPQGQFFEHDLFALIEVRG